MNQAIDELVEIIANSGVLGSCNALCSQLTNELEATVCNLLCDYIGIKAFVTLLDDADPDPIFYCEEITVCPINLYAKGVITKAVVNPPSGPAGTNFNILVTYQITNITGTGTLEIDINPPASDGGSPFGDSELLVAQPPAVYQVQFQLDTTPSEQEAFSPGSYLTQISLCEGTCGSTHSYSFVMASVSTKFTITAS